MKLNLVIEKNCDACARVQAALEKVVAHAQELELFIFDVETQNEFNAQIVPALYLEKKLFAIGEFDVDKLKSITS